MSKHTHQNSNQINFMPLLLCLLIVATTFLIIATQKQCFAATSVIYKTKTPKYISKSVVYAGEHNFNIFITNNLPSEILYRGASILGYTILEIKNIPNELAATEHKIRELIYKDHLIRNDMSRNYAVWINKTSTLKNLNKNKEIETIMMFMAKNASSMAQAKPILPQNTAHDFYEMYQDGKAFFHDYLPKIYFSSRCKSFCKVQSAITAITKYINNLTKSRKSMPHDIFEGKIMFAREEKAIMQNILDNLVKNKH